MAIIREVAFNSPQYWDILKLREEILSKPAGLSVFQNSFEREWEKYHIGAFVGGKLAGCTMLCPEINGQMRLRQMAVWPAFQNQGIGRDLVAFSEKFALEKGFSVMILAGRKTAAGFYEKYGYHIVRAEFVQIGIPHVGMEKLIK